MSKTLYLENTVLSTKIWRMAEDAPASADEVTSVKNGKTSANYFAFIPGATDNAVNSSSFIEGDADGAHGWRSQQAYSGTFASGNWTVTYKVKNRAAYAHSGRLYARIYHSYVNNPTTAQLVKMNSVDGYSGIISFSATAGEVKTGSFVVNCDQNLALDGEVIFIILNWLVTTAGGNVNAGVKFLVNEGSAEQVVTTNFTTNQGQDQVIVGGNADALFGAATEYNNVMGGSGWNAAENQKYNVMPTGGNLGVLFVELSANIGAGASGIFTLMVNGVATGVAVTINAGGATGSDSDVVAVVAGDTVSLRATYTGTPGTPWARWTFKFTGTTAGESICMVHAACSKTVTQFFPLQAANRNATEANVQTPIPTAGTFKKLYVQLDVDPGTSPDAYRFTARKDTASQTLTCTITANATIGNDTVNTFTNNAGEPVNWMVEPLNVPVTASDAAVSCVFVSDTTYESLILGVVADNPGTSGIEYMHLCPAGNTLWDATEANVYSLIQACTLKKLYVSLTVAPGAGKSYSLRPRIEAGVTGIVVTISGTVPSGNDTVNTYSPSNGDTAGIECAPSGTPAATVVRWGIVCYIAPAVAAVAFFPRSHGYIIGCYIIPLPKWLKCAYNHIRRLRLWTKPSFSGRLLKPRIGCRCHQIWDLPCHDSSRYSGLGISHRFHPSMPVPIAVNNSTLRPNF